MSDIIAFYGSPGAGKTSIALKTAMECYLMSKTDEYVMFLSPDLIVPSIALLFPNYVPDELASLSSILDSTSMTEELILKNTVTVKSLKDFGCLGFTAGETKFSFPIPTNDKINDFFDTLMNMAGYIIVDCTDSDDDFISQKAMQLAEKKIRVVTPDLKGMAWLSSHKDTPEEDITVVNTTEKNLFLPVADVCEKIGGKPIVLPYSLDIRQQLIDGTMYERLKDKKFNKAMGAIVKEII